MTIVEKIGEPAVLEQLAEEAVELARASLKLAEEAVELARSTRELLIEVLSGEHD